MNVTAILCVADNVSDFMEDCAEVLETVFDCSRSVPGKLSLGVNLKLVITSAMKSTQSIWKMNPLEHLSLVAGNMISVGQSEYDGSGYWKLCSSPRHVLARGTWILKRGRWPSRRYLGCPMRFLRILQMQLTLQ